MKNSKRSSIALFFCATLLFSSGTAFSQYRSLANGTYYGTSWVTLTSTTMQTVESHSFYLAIPTTVYIECTGQSLTDNAIIKYGYSINGSTTEVPTSRRYDGALNSTDVYSSMQTSRLYALPAGTHTVNFLAAVYKTSGTAPVARINNMAIHALVFETGNVRELELTTPEESDGGIE